MESAEAKAIWQDMVDDHSLTGSYQSVRRFVRSLPRRRKALDKNWSWTYCEIDVILGL